MIDACELMTDEERKLAVMDSTEYHHKTEEDNLINMLASEDMSDHVLALYMMAEVSSKYLSNEFRNSIIPYIESYTEWVDKILKFYKDDIPAIVLSRYNIERKRVLHKFNILDKI